MKDLLLGCFSGYDYKQLQYWINSIKMSGFEGDVVVIVGNASYATVEKLVQKGVKIVAFGRDEAKHQFVYTPTGPIQTERFFYFWNFLKDRLDDYRYVIITDMKDVIFQTNPSKYLEQYANLEDFSKTHLLVSSECLLYKDEPWGRENLQQGFGPVVYNALCNNFIYNVGIIAGTPTYVKDLCLAIYTMSINRPIAIVEQAAFNVILSWTPLDDCTQYMDLADGWAAHLGTVMDPDKIESFRPHLLEPEPHLEKDHIVCNSSGDVICVVHQYDRVPALKAMYESYYGDK